MQSCKNSNRCFMFHEILQMGSKWLLYFQFATHRLILNAEYTFHVHSSASQFLSVWNMLVFRWNFPESRKEEQRAARTGEIPGLWIPLGSLRVRGPTRRRGARSHRRVGLVRKWGLWNHWISDGSLFFGRVPFLHAICLVKSPWWWVSCSERGGIKFIIWLKNRD